MKNILITIILFQFINVITYAQDKLTNVIVETGLPSGLEELNEQKKLSLMRVRKKKGMDLLNNRGIYKFGNIIVQVNGGTGEGVCQ